MNAILQLLKDHYFWFGIVLFLFSIAGIVWILRSLQNHSESEMILPAPHDDENPIYTPPVMPRTSVVKPASEPAVNSTQTIPASAPVKPASGDMAQQLANIEKALLDISKKLDQPNSLDLSADLKAALQAIQSGGGKADSEQLNRLAAKIDKLYQVITALSTEDKL